MALRLCRTKLSPFKSPRFYATFTKSVTVTDDETTFVAWHPPQDFPYECTRPLPEEKVVVSESVLKNTLSPELQVLFRKKNPDNARAELAAITHTTVHRWFPRARDKRAKKTPPDRDYL